MRVEPGEQLHGRPGVHVAVVADTDALIATLTSVEDDRAGTESHLHRRHADCFLVLSGALRLRFAGEEHVIEADSWAQVPQGVIHAYTPAETGATFLNIHAPACGFGPYLRALSGESELDIARATFDQHSPDESIATGTEVVVCRLGGMEGETVTDRPGRRVTLLADTDELSVTESAYSPLTRGPDLHIHHDHTDAWLVLDGELAFTLRDGIGFEAAAGTFVSVPPGVVHGFMNAGAVPARFLNFHAPGCGFGDYIRGRNPNFDQHPQRDGGGDPGTVTARRVEL